MKEARHDNIKLAISNRYTFSMVQGLVATQFETGCAECALIDEKLHAFIPVSKWAVDYSNTMATDYEDEVVTGCSGNATADLLQLAIEYVEKYDDR